MVWISILRYAVVWGFHSRVTSAPRDVYTVWEGGRDLKHCLQATRVCMALCGQTGWNGDESHTGGLRAETLQPLPFSRLWDSRVSLAVSRAGRRAFLQSSWFTWRFACIFYWGFGLFWPRVFVTWSWIQLVVSSGGFPQWEQVLRSVGVSFN